MMKHAIKTSMKFVVQLNARDTEEKYKNHEGCEGSGIAEYE